MAIATFQETAAPWTIADLHRLLGPIPFDRIRHDPAPGTATEKDVVAIHEREKLAYELIDGVLVRKTMGAHESYLACLLSTLVNNFVRPRKLGMVLAADGMYRLSPGLVRIPDVSFVSGSRLPNRRIPRDPICLVVPDLAVEVLSKSNTKKEMDRKLEDYFRVGVRLVWYVDPVKRQAKVFTAVDQSRVVREHEILDGEEVLPGFTVSLRELFADPSFD